MKTKNICFYTDICCLYKNTDDCYITLFKDNAVKDTIVKLVASKTIVKI